MYFNCNAHFIAFMIMIMIDVRVSFFIAGNVLYYFYNLFPRGIFSENSLFKTVQLLFITK